ncbi:hypothetical protein SFOMI_0778 [Sphingobium fuliginis]|uniref:Uncharacterized protein n=1 Tax=Sphingobium fuliginis (strain ATCC 27551) TaxID=336203 RepID=A0A292ZBU3_SPHSA|nr:hypothetical protein SFOMI_0778 [Sphingobium fuliginis]
MVEYCSAVLTYSVQDERDADGRAATAIGDRMEAALQWANEALGN